MPKYVKPILDYVITVFLWIYYVIGYIIFFWPVHLWIYFFSSDYEIGFQKVNRRFFQCFFFLMRLMTPGLKFNISSDVKAIRSSVIVCNHLSYLDPLLLISLYDMQKTVVKSTFFKVPLFGWVLKNSGNLPSDTSGYFFDLMIKRIERMSDYLSAGGNIFIFPEGTRSRDGTIGTFNKGAFSIAKKCRAPIAILKIRSTSNLLPPGKILLNTCVDIKVSVDLISILKPAYDDDDFSLTKLVEGVRKRYEDDK